MACSTLRQRKAPKEQKDLLKIFKFLKSIYGRFNSESVNLFITIPNTAHRQYIYFFLISMWGEGAVRSMFFEFTAI